VREKIMVQEKKESFLVFYYKMFSGKEGLVQ